MECYRVRYKKCVVPGCQDIFAKKHTFPKNDLALFEKWKNQVQNPILNSKSDQQIYNSYRVCHLHFAEEDRVPGTKRGLRKKAFPTKFLPHLTGVSSETSSNSTGGSLNANQPLQSHVANQPLQSHVGTSCAQADHHHPYARLGQSLLTTSSYGSSEFRASLSRNLSRVLSVAVPEDTAALETTYLGSPNSLSSRDYDGDASDTFIERSATSTVKRSCKTKRRVLKLVNTSRQSDLTPRARRLYKMCIVWGNKMSLLSIRLKSYQSRLREAEKAIETNDLHKVFEHVNTSTYNFILSHIKTHKKPKEPKKPKEGIFTVDEKVTALSLFKASGKGYRFLSKIFSLPSRKSLTNFLNKIPLEPGINDLLFLNLEESVKKMSEKQKYCVLMFDELPLSCHVQYNKEADIMEGIDNSGSSPGIIDHAWVFMLRDIYSRWKQPLCFTFSDGPVKTIFLKNMIKIVIEKCQEIGLHVVATVCDQEGSSQAAISSLLKDTDELFQRQNQNKKCFGFFINGQEIIPFYDVPNLFKGLRNNLLEKDLHFHYKGRDMVAKWEHIEALYCLDSTHGDAICSKLTDKHIFKHSINKMKVSICMQVFSRQVGSLMKRMVSWGDPDKTNLGPAADDTAELILFLDELFDSLNADSKVAPSTKPLRRAMIETSEHEAYWKMSIEVLKTMKFYSAKKRSFVTVPSLKNLIHSIQGFIYLKYVLPKFRFNFIFTRFFNQDPLKNAFSYIRSQYIRNVHPTPSHFMSSFKTLLLMSHPRPHRSPCFDCEEDPSIKLLADLRTFLVRDTSRESTYSKQSPDLTDLKRNIVPLHKKNKIGQCTLTYCAGYIAKKMDQVMKKYKCDTCRKNLLLCGTNSDIDFIEVREYKSKLLLMAGGFLKFLVSQALLNLYYLIPRLVCVKNISEFLKQMLIVKVDFTSVNCIEHNLSERICVLLIKCAIYFWCKKVNRIACGQDPKFVKFVKNCTNKKIIDPIKIRAVRKSKIRRKLKKNI